MLHNAIRIGDGENKATGRWRLNSGSEMEMTVPGISKTPIRIVLDLATTKFAGDRIVALSDHDKGSVIGYWDRLAVTSQGLEGDLHLMEPKDEKEAMVLAEAVRVGAIARSGVPIQVSVGDSGVGQFELVDSEDVLTCNGKDYDGDGELPLYVVKGAVVREASIVTFGADSVTGRIAARQHTPVKEEPMSKELLAKLTGEFPEQQHGLIARCVVGGDDETVIRRKIQANVNDANLKRINELSVENETLKQSCENYKIKLAEYENKMKAGEKEIEKDEKKEKEKMKAAGSKTGVTFADSSGKTAVGQPENILEAMEHEVEGGSKLRGVALHKFCCEKYPALPRTGRKVVIDG